MEPEREVVKAKHGVSMGSTFKPTQAWPAQRYLFLRDGEMPTNCR